MCSVFTCSTSKILLYVYDRWVTLMIEVRAIVLKHSFSTFRVVQCTLNSVTVSQTLYSIKSMIQKHFLNTTVTSR